MVIGNSYAQVLHAHLLTPVSADMTKKFAHVGQNSIVLGSTDAWFWGGDSVKVKFACPGLESDWSVYIT